MSQWRRLFLATGHLAPLAPPILLAASAISGLGSLAFGGLIIVAPFLRVLFGDSRRRVVAWPEAMANVLESVPVTAAALYGLAIACLLLRGAGALGRADDVLDAFACSASLWAAFIFGTCVAHELIHRKSRVSVVLGRVLCGALGYPFLEREHQLHHRRAGTGCSSECADVAESAWRFAAQRLRAVGRDFFEDCVRVGRCRDRRGMLRLGIPLVGFIAASGTFATVGASWLAAYALVAMAVAWTIQFINYIQHWGLGTAGNAICSWEDRCLLQAWLTLGISYHQAHHDCDAIAYYRLRPRRDAPQLPAGYVFLLVAAMLPPLWRRLMLPALSAWEAGAVGHRSAGRRLICFSRRIDPEKR